MTPLQKGLQRTKEWTKGKNLPVSSCFMYVPERYAKPGQGLYSQPCELCGKRAKKAELCYRCMAKVIDAQKEAGVIPRTK